jgi:hypothetical protein
VGFTQIELWPEPMTVEALEAMAPLLTMLDASHR